MLRSALDVAPSPPFFAPFLIMILVSLVAIIAMLILLRLILKSRP
jgi:NADH:ubiquinone oxidoreductase subunit 3 (subunit A)